MSSTCTDRTAAPPPLRGATSTTTWGTCSTMAASHTSAAGCLPLNTLTMHTQPFPPSRHPPPQTPRLHNLRCPLSLHPPALTKPLSPTVRGSSPGTQRPPPPPPPLPPTATPTKRMKRDISQRSSQRSNSQQKPYVASRRQRRCFRPTRTRTTTWGWRRSRRTWGLWPRARR